MSRALHRSMVERTGAKKFRAGFEPVILTDAIMPVAPG